jgi:large subunit ribosomal protein L10
MKMRKEDKAALVDEIADSLGDAEAIFAVDYRGITVPQAAELRSKLADADTTFRVVKNRLAKRATERAGQSELDQLLVGPTALAFVRGDAVAAAKAISAFGRQHDLLSYKGGLMDGASLTPEQFTTIARLPGVEVLRGQLLGTVASPLTGLVRGLSSLISGMAVALGQIAEQGLVTGSAEGPPPEGEATEAPPAEADEEESPEEGAAEEESPAEEEPEQAAGDATEGEAAKGEAAAEAPETSDEATNDEAGSAEEPEAPADGSEGSASEEDQ